METAEVKKNTRVKHLYKRREVYHRFVHSDSYVYCSPGTYQISGLGNILIKNNIGKYTRIEDLPNRFKYIKDQVLAVIDRDNKKILIKANEYAHRHDILCALPDDYERFFTNDVIAYYDVIYDMNECYRLHSKYLIESLIAHSLNDFYCVLNDKTKKTLSISLNNVINTYSYDTIVRFVKEKKLKKSDFYNTCFNEKFNITKYCGWNRKHNITIKLPTLKQIVTNAIFTKSEKLYLEKRYFYTKYCYGEGIYFKDVLENWNKEVSVEEFRKFCKKRKIYFQDDYINNISNWNECVSKTITTNNVFLLEQYKKDIAKSDENRKEAETKLIQQFEKDYTIDDWRKNISLFPKCISVKYDKFVPNRNRRTGTWTKGEVIRYPHNSSVLFKNTQLKLGEHKDVITSRYASVPFSAAVTMYKMFTKLKEKYGTNLSMPFNGVKVGIYNLRFIKYTDKKTDSGEDLKRKDYLVQIGCHSIWLEEVEEFIKYYKLEKEFGIEQ